MGMRSRFRSFIVLLGVLVAACGGVGKPTSKNVSVTPRVLAVETFLTDIAQNVAGDRLKVGALLPIGVDPHSYEPAPSDIARVVESDLIIINGAGAEAFFQKLLANSGTQSQVVEASRGLTPRQPGAQEAVQGTGAAETDPHFWLDPVSVIRYVENIRDALSKVDPVWATSYSKNADAYIAQLKDLDNWIRQQVALIPEGRRLLVTNHESLGYYADRYGFKVVGTIIPSVTTGASPSAQSLAALEDAIRATGAPAVFLESGVNPQMAQQVSLETGIKVAPELYTHSISAAGGPAPTYIDMLKYNTQVIVEALK